MPNNAQKPSPLEQDSSFITVHSLWPTVQGEGPFAGRVATFIRLAGCNLQCPFCDTDYTGNRFGVFYNDPQNVPPGYCDLLDLTEHVSGTVPIRGEFALVDRHLVVITGGEPFRQNIAPLVTHLLEAGFDVQIETNGTLYLDIHPRATIVCSPKTPRINTDLAMRAKAFKYVMDAGHVHPDDGLPTGALGCYGTPARPPRGWEGRIYLQPLDEGDPEKNKNNLAVCVQSVMKHGYNLCIQTHKIANLP